MLSPQLGFLPATFVVGIGAADQPRAFLTLPVRDTRQCDSELRQVLQRLRRASGTWVAVIRQPVRGFPQQLIL